MADPSPYILAKLTAGIGGLFGGLALMSFIRPKNVADAAIRGGISTGSGIIFASPVLSYMHLRTDWEMQLMAGVIIGFVAWSILSMVARFFQKAEEDKSDIFDVVSRVRSNVSFRPKTTRKRKTTKKKRVTRHGR